MDGTNFGACFGWKGSLNPQVPWALREGTPPWLRPGFGVLLLGTPPKGFSWESAATPIHHAKRDVCLHGAWCAIFMRISDIDIHNLIQFEYAFLTSGYMYVYVCDLCLRTYLVLESCGIIVVTLQTF